MFAAAWVNNHNAGEMTLTQLCTVSTDVCCWAGLHRHNHHTLDQTILTQQLQLVPDGRLRKRSQPFATGLVFQLSGT
jgi:hypothetical protein